MPGRDQLKPMERLVRIMAVLEQAGSAGATAERLLQVADYGDADPKTQLGHDLKHLRNQGWEITNIGGSGNPARYRMVPGDNRLRLRLEADQLAVLQRAVLMANRGDLAKRLDIDATALPEGLGSARVERPVSGELAAALLAVQGRSRIGFVYKGTRRLVSPGGVRLRNHLWYLSGVEDGSDIVKHFVVNRMSDAHVEGPGSADDVPDIQRIPLHPLLWEVDDPTEVVVSCEADYVPDVERWLRAPDLARRVRERVELTYTVTNCAAFRARIYVLGRRVSIVRPSEFRDELVAELRALVGA